MGAESGMSRSAGSCNTMGTASTMASLTEALGISLPMNAALPAVDSRRKVLAHLSGNRIVQLVKDDIKPSDIMTRDAFENAILMHAAIGGSTNAVVHLLALAGRLGVPLTLKDFDEIARDSAAAGQPDALGQASYGGLLLTQAARRRWPRSETGPALLAATPSPSPARPRRGDRQTPPRSGTAR